ncbi:MAG: tRNA preQ1(34) S-adenosylmethionine ribosyltransferase-isomerase QueA [Acidobacteriota bacterium]|nr:MAG: tRNA preQ1(34) S-adenosylmethionine ribosyltransferase-isomerase QueA [Acidobacteriota bacterium]
MDVSLFDYELPRKLIAQQAVEPRDAARLMLLDRGSNRCEHLHVYDLPELLAPGDLLVVNDTRVLMARLIALKPSGGRVELLLLELLEAGPGEARTWSSLVSASRIPPRGQSLVLPDGYTATLLDGPDEQGRARVRLAGPGPIELLLEQHGRAPLPPYIRRHEGDSRLETDRQRYQTVFARHAGAVAAPTAGLHFTPELIDRLQARQIDITALTLHVGAGTFLPVHVRRTEQIELHAERFSVSATCSHAIARTRAAGGRIIAVGTTVVRALESRAPAPDGGPQSGAGVTRLFIAPEPHGHQFRFVDMLLTNFHLPRSTLLMLVASFAGRERVLDAYREAIERSYRFYSYGDAMLVR